MSNICSISFSLDLTLTPYSLFFSFDFTSSPASSHTYTYTYTHGSSFGSWTIDLLNFLLPPLHVTVKGLRRRLTTCRQRQKYEDSIWHESQLGKGFEREGFKFNQSGCEKVSWEKDKSRREEEEEEIAKNLQLFYSRGERERERERERRHSFECASSVRVTKWKNLH